MTSFSQHAKKRRRGKWYWEIIKENYTFTALKQWLDIEKQDQFWERNDSRKNKINPSNLINWAYITNNWYENKYTNKNIHSLKYKNWIKIHHKITEYLNLLCCCEIKMQDFVVNDYN